jgi:hypothetical protein
MSLESIRTELRRELARLGSGGAISEVVAAWPEAVGKEIAGNAWPARIGRDGTLYVSTSSSAWAFELTHLEDTVRARLEERLSKAVPPRLRFAPGPLPELGAEGVKPLHRVAPRPSPSAEAAAAEIAADIASPELREAVARASAASLTGAEARSADRPV